MIFKFFRHVKVDKLKILYPFCCVTIHGLKGTLSSVILEILKINLLIFIFYVRFLSDILLR